jgi:GT2 family glycosyltransferase
MDISICILNRNQKVLLEKCLTSCIAELERSPLSAEIIVVDNASNDGSREIVAQLFPDIRLICNRENMGFSSANNKGIRASSGRYLLILNNDTILLPGCLNIMVTYMESNPDVGAVGPKLLNPDRSMQQGYNRSFPRLVEPFLLLFGLHRCWPGRAFFDRLGKIDEGLIDPTPIEQIAACSLLLRRATLDSVGLFDESFHYWFEDVELCHRIIKQGWRVYYLPEARIIHHGGVSFASIAISEQLTMYLFGILRYFKKQRGRLQFAALKSMAVVAILFRLLVAGLLSMNPSAKARKRWSGKPTAYWRMLHMVISNPSVPPMFTTV